MPEQRTGWAWTGLVVTMVALATVGGALAQNPPHRTKAARKTGPARLPNQVNPLPVPAQAANAADPLANPLVKDALRATYHYKLKLTSYDNVPLAATYYPTRTGTTSPVILMVHEKDRSSKDFEDPVTELKNQGFAEYLQAQGYAVLTFDLRGHGANARRTLTPRDWRLMVNDLQTAYQFLIDRNNRGELNLGKLGVLAMGEGANLAAAWAVMPAGAVASEDRPSDLGALVLISPMADGEGFLLKTVLAQLAPRFPLMLMAGERDAVSGDPVRAARQQVERVRLNRVELFPSSLHGYKLLRLEPRVTAAILKFFEGTIKFKNAEWEPRYNLNPVALSKDIQTIPNKKVAAQAKEAAPVPAKEKEQEKAAEQEKAKADEPAQPKDAVQAKEAAPEK